MPAFTKAMNSIQSGDSVTTFWNTTPTFGTTPHRAVGTLGQFFAAPPQLLEHHPIGVTRTSTGQGRSSGTPGPPTRPRATPYMVRVLVQPLKHHPTEPQGQTAILDHFSMAGGTQAKNADESIDTPVRARPTEPSRYFTPFSANLGFWCKIC